MSSMKGVTFSDVLDPHAVDQAKRFEALVVAERAKFETPDGKAKVERCMDWLAFCATLPIDTIPTLDAYHAWKGKVRS